MTLDNPWHSPLFKGVHFTLFCRYNQTWLKRNIRPDVSNVTKDLKCVVYILYLLEFRPSYLVQSKWVCVLYFCVTLSTRDTVTKYRQAKLCMHGHVCWQAINHWPTTAVKTDTIVKNEKSVFNCMMQTWKKMFWHWRTIAVLSYGIAEHGGVEW